MVLDQNKRLQEAECSAWVALEDEDPQLAPYLEPVPRNLVFAFDQCRHKNSLILYDTVGTVADAVGSASDVRGDSRASRPHALLEAQGRR